MIPNIIYFVFGFKEQTEDFVFCYYLSVYSAFIVNKPEKIFFYYHYEPHGKWWDKLKQISVISFIKIDIPENIGSKPIIHAAHKSDIVRMNLLYNNGGIYLDIDTISVKPYSHLLNNQVVLGKEGDYGICNAIMMTEPESNFFKIWLEQYEIYFNPNGWNESSIVLPHRIAFYHRDLLTLMPEDTFFSPSWGETEKIFVDNNDIPDNLITLHLWGNTSYKYINDIDGWDWRKNNSHTLYAKLLQNLLDNYDVDLS